jgi:hypothetical protein
MDSELGWGQGEDEPSVVGVDIVQLEDVTEEGAGLLGVLAVHDGVGGDDHGPILVRPGVSRGIGLTAWAGGHTSGVRRGWLAVAAVVTLAGCGGGSARSGSASPTQTTAATAGTVASTTSTSAPPATTLPPPTTEAPLAAGTEGGRAAVPWSEVGPGWILAEWDPVTAVPPGSSPASGPAPTTLYLVDPAGGRYLITTFPASTFNVPGDLVAWSGDGRRALFTESVSVTGGSGLGTTITELDLATAATHSFTIQGNAEQVGYTRPDGTAIVVALETDDSTATIERMDTSGVVQLTYPTSFAGAGSTAGGFLYSPDGSELVFATTAGLELVSNGGAPVTALPIPGNANLCVPQRWWDSATVLAECNAGTSRLWLVPVSGATPTALTAALTGQGEDLGDEDAWALPSGTFLQDAGPCGYQYLAKLQPDGTTEPVDVPGVKSGDSVLVAGADGSRLAIRATISCGPGETLAWYDPGAGTATPLLGPPVNGGSVIDALLFPA